MTQSTKRLSVQRLSPLPGAVDEHEEIRRGLARTPPELAPKFLYDAEGSRLFDEITGLDEYYPTRVEAAILAERADEIMQAVRPDELLELGSGASSKTRALLEAMHRVGGSRYVPFDVSEDAVREAADALCGDYDWLEVRGLIGDFHSGVSDLPHEGRRLVAFLGSTIGNLYPLERAEFLIQLRSMLRAGDALLIGFDRRKEIATLEAAYNDSRGITAAFSLNSLRVFNRRLDANFPLDAFRYEGVWNEASSWIEMRLVAERDVRVRIEGLGLDFKLDAGEHLRTEVSTKFEPSGFGAELKAAGLEPARWFEDEAGRFGLVLAHPVG